MDKENQINYIAKTARVGKKTTLHAPVRLVGSATVKHSCEVGKYTFINSGTTVFPGTHIGRYCSIGKNCEIGAFDHPLDWLSTSSVQYNAKLIFPDYADRFTQKPISRPDSTHIGNDVWIGSLALIKRGISISDGSIVAGGAVVVKDVPPYSIVGGVPAKVLRSRFPEHLVERLQKLAWWDLPEDDLRDINFDDIDTAIKELEALRR
jgi:acetyltransferase-like isoleucine patch superfamily enzyme